MSSVNLGFIGNIFFKVLDMDNYLGRSKHDTTAKSDFFTAAKALRLLHFATSTTELISKDNMLLSTNPVAF